MSLLAEHLFGPKSRERLREDLQRINDEGIRSLKALLKRQHDALRLGRIVNPHVLPHVQEPEPDFEAMNRLIRGSK